jgi:glutaredoxin
MAGIAASLPSGENLNRVTSIVFEIMASMKHVDGKNKGDITLYALSTCAWCKKTKNLLKELGVDYKFIYLDLLEDEEREEVMSKIKCSQSNFPITVINNKCIVGYEEQKIREAIAHA